MADCFPELLKRDINVHDNKLGVRIINQLLNSGIAKYNEWFIGVSKIDYLQASAFSYGK